MQVLISYGGKSNSELLGGYGFLVPGNVWDTYDLTNFSAQLSEAVDTGLLAPALTQGNQILNEIFSTWHVRHPPPLPLCSWWIFPLTQTIAMHRLLMKMDKRTDHPLQPFPDGCPGWG